MTWLKLLGASSLMAGLAFAAPANDKPAPSGQGGSGQTGIVQEWRGCAQALSTPEPSTVVTGKVRHASKDLLTLEGPRGRRVDLHADAETCLLWNGEPIQPSQLGKDTAVQVSFVNDPQEGMTARVVRVIEQQRPAP